MQPAIEVCVEIREGLDSFAGRVTDEGVFWGMQVVYGQNKMNGSGHYLDPSVEVNVGLV
jgi:hypothetical protein